MPDLKRDHFVRSSRWPEPVPTDLVERVTGLIRIPCTTTTAGHYVDQHLPESALLLRVQRIQPAFASSRHLGLSPKALHYRLASLRPALSQVTGLATASPTDLLPKVVSVAARGPHCRRGKAQASLQKEVDGASQT